jgi:hypothetical protein
MEKVFMSLRLFSATSAYFCDLKSEWPQIFEKWCSSTDSKMVGHRWLANSNPFYVKKLWRMSEISLASPKPNKSYFIASCSFFTKLSFRSSFELLNGFKSQMVQKWHKIQISIFFCDLVPLKNSTIGLTTSYTVAHVLLWFIDFLTRLALRQGHL